MFSWSGNPRNVWTTILQRLPWGITTLSQVRVIGPAGPVVHGDARSNPAPSADWKSSFSRLKACGSRMVVAQDGARGCLVGSGKGQHWWHAFVGSGVVSPQDRRYIQIYIKLYAYKIQYHIMNYIGDPQLEMHFLMIFHWFFLMASQKTEPPVADRPRSLLATQFQGFRTDLHRTAGEPPPVPPDQSLSSGMGGWEDGMMGWLGGMEDIVQKMVRWF